MGALTIRLVGALILVCLPAPIFTQNPEDIQGEEEKYVPVKFVNRLKRDIPVTASNDTSAAAELKAKKLEPQGAKRGVTGKALMGVVNLLLRQQKNGKPQAKTKKGAVTTTPAPGSDASDQKILPKRPAKKPQGAPLEQDQSESESARANMGSSRPPWETNAPLNGNNMGGGPNCAQYCNPPPSLDACSVANIYDREVTRPRGPVTDCCNTFKCYNPDGSYFSFHGSQGVLAGTNSYAQFQQGGGLGNSGFGNNGGSGNSNGQGGYNNGQGGSGYGNQGGTNNEQGGYGNQGGYANGQGGSGYGNQGMTNNGQGNSNYGNQGAPNNGQGDSGYGNQGVPNNGQGGSGYGNQGIPNNGQGGSGYGNQGMTNNGQGNSNYGNQGVPNNGQGNSNYGNQGGSINGPGGSGYGNQGVPSNGQGGSGYGNQGVPNNGPGGSGYANQGGLNGSPPVSGSTQTANKKAFEEFQKLKGVTGGGSDFDMGFDLGGIGSSDYVVDTAKMPTDGRKYGGVHTDRVVLVAGSGKANVEASAHDATHKADDDEEPEGDIYDMEYELEKVQKQNQRMMDSLSKDADAALPNKGRSLGKHGRGHSRSEE